MHPPRVTPAVQKECLSRFLALRFGGRKLKDVSSSPRLLDPI